MRAYHIVLLAMLLAACSGDDGAADDVLGDAAADTTHDTVSRPSACLLDSNATADYLQQLGCQGDFGALASAPLDASIPGARSIKTVIDRLDGDALYFQDSEAYTIHWDFARAHLSGGGRPPVPPLSEFNQTEYYSPYRRFLLGAVTWYAEPGVWAYEIAPYDTASADMVAAAFRAIDAATWFGAELRFHPTSEAVARLVPELPADVRIITTDALFAGITYQPLNLGTSTGKLRFLEASALDEATLNFRDIVVLGRVPNDIAVVSGIITASYQTPLSHINVLSQNRGTPNMALIGAFEDVNLTGLDGKWVELTVGPWAWGIREITQAEAEAWWEANRPPPVGVPDLDLNLTALSDVEDLLDQNLSIADALDQAIPAWGGKASHYAVLPRMGDKVPYPPAFAIPVFHYDHHMRRHGLDQNVSAMLADEGFRGDAAVRAQRLEALRAAIVAAPIDQDLLGAVLAHIQTRWAGLRMRFRSSTNAEDLAGFTGAGLYTSRTGVPGDPDKGVERAIKEVWASLWHFKAFEERSFRSIDHGRVAMGLLVHRSFPSEEANGVAITGNLFDTAGLEPAFVVNVQKGSASVVQPQPGITSDYFIYYFYYPNQPTVFLSHSNLVPTGTNVLTLRQTFELGEALSRIHQTFAPVYGGGDGFYGMDVELKFDGLPGQEPALWIKQARPHPGWGL